MLGIGNLQLLSIIQEKTEVHRCEVTCPRPHSRLGAGIGLENSLISTCFLLP